MKFWLIKEISFSPVTMVILNRCIYERGVLKDHLRQVLFNLARSIQEYFNIRKMNDNRWHMTTGLKSSHCL